MLSFLLAASLVLPAQDSGFAYRATLLRASPGRLLELIDLVKAHVPMLEAAGAGQPLIMRHSQGDQWDLLILEPIGTMTDAFSAGRQARLEHAASNARMTESDYERRMHDLVAWREELFVDGPPIATLDARRDGAGFFH